MRVNRSQSRRKFLIQSSLLLGATTISGCLGDQDDPDDPDPTPPDVDPSRLVIGFDRDAPTLDPIRYQGLGQMIIIDNIFDSLYTYDEVGDFVPELATDQPEISRDGTRWAIEIEEDAEFQDGSPVTSEDIIYTLEQPVIEERGNASDFAMIDAMESIDEKSVQIDLEFPYARFQTSLDAHVAPKAIREEHKTGTDQEWQDNIVGSGPFELVDWATGEEVEMTAWADYWQGNPSDIDELVFSYIEEPSTRVTTLQTGETDMIRFIPPDLHQNIDEMEHASLSLIEGLRVNYMAFNCREGPTADINVRRAIDHCVDMDLEIDLFVEGFGKRIYSLLPPAIIEAWDFPEDQWKNIRREYDIDAAKELLDDADISEDYELKFLYPYPEIEEIVVSITNGIEEAGYTASPIRLEWGTFVSTFNTGSADDMNMYWLAGGGDPDPGPLVHSRYHSDRWGADNGTYYENEEVFAMIEAADSTVDRDERRQLYIDILTTVLEDFVHIPAFAEIESWGVGNHISGFEPIPVPSKNPIMVSPDQNVTVE